MQSLHEDIIARIIGGDRVDLSLDSVDNKHGDHGIRFPTEFLSSLSISDLPHKLALKVRITVILL